MFKQSKTLVTIELNVPWEENCVESHESKSPEVHRLDGRLQGWRMVCLAVSCRGLFLKVSSRITVEAAHKIRNLGKSMQNSNKKTGKAAEVEVILLDMALWR